MQESLLFQEPHKDHEVYEQHERPHDDQNSWRLPAILVLAIQISPHISTDKQNRSYDGPDENENFH